MYGRACHHHELIEEGDTLEDTAELIRELVNEFELLGTKIARGGRGKKKKVGDVGDLGQSYPLHSIF